MRLYYSETSPYARKVRLVVHEKGLTTEVGQTLCNPWDDPAELLALNPLGKVPVLITRDGQPLFDSPVICDYLDGLTPAPRLIPEAGAARWRVWRNTALADGLTDAAYNVVMEDRRPAPQQSASWAGRWRAEIGRVLDALERESTGLRGDPDLSHLATAAALGYLDFRLPELGWRTGRPGLSDWYGRFRERPSMRATEPR